MRPIADIILLISAIVFPWWFTVPLAFGLSFRFHKFYEIILAGLVIDLLFSTPLNIFLDFHFIFTAGAILALIIIESSKKYLRFYSN